MSPIDNALVYIVFQLLPNSPYTMIFLNRVCSGIGAAAALTQPTPSTTPGSGSSKEVADPIANESWGAGSPTESRSVDGRVNGPYEAFSGAVSPILLLQIPLPVMRDSCKVPQYDRNKPAQGGPSDQ